MNQALVGYLSLAGSLALHGYAVTRSSSRIAMQTHEPQPSFVEFTAPEPLPEPPPEPPPLPEPEPEPAPKPSPPERLQPGEKAPEPAAERSTLAAEAAEPPKLTGVTLTADSGATFEAPVGNGEASEGAVVAPGRSKGARVSQLTAPERRASAPPPPALPLSQLSRKPVPPSLGVALERNYPRQARSLGQSGNAKVRARIERDGEVRNASIVFATSPDFGEACRRTLIGSRWSAPLDKNGRAAATWVFYQCRFHVD